MDYILATQKTLTGAPLQKKQYYDPHQNQQNRINADVFFGYDTDAIRRPIRIQPSEPPLTEQ
jgi:hypothetical protein